MYFFSLNTEFFASFYYSKQYADHWKVVELISDVGYNFILVMDHSHLKLCEFPDIVQDAEKTVFLYEFWRQNETKKLTFFSFDQIVFSSKILDSRYVFRKVF